MEVDVGVSSFGASSDPWHIEQALQVEVLVHDFAKVAEGRLDLVFSVQLLRAQNQGEGLGQGGCGCVRVIGGTLALHALLDTDFGFFGHVDWACLIAASIWCAHILMWLVVHLKVHTHGVEAGAIQGGSVHQLGQALPALTWQELEPGCEVLSAHCFSGQAAKEPLGAYCGVMVCKCMDRSSHHGSICLPATQASSQPHVLARVSDCQVSVDSDLTLGKQAPMQQWYVRQQLA